MQSKTLRGFCLLLPLGATLACAQQTSIRQEILQLYNFQPRLLSDQEMTRKSGDLDRFWAKAQSQPGLYLPELRRELANFANPPVFLYDGSLLLLVLSDTPADRRVALAAMARTDLRDLRHTEYFMQVHRLAALNEDTTAAALHILDQQDFRAAIPEHALTLGQDYSLIYLLLPIDPNLWIRPAIARLRVERDATAQRSLLLALWYAQTDEADGALRNFAADFSKSTDNRTYAEELLGRESGLDAAQLAGARSVSDATVRLQRRQQLQVVSDEGLAYLEEFTRILISKRR